MAEIELSGYKTFIPNRVFYRENIRSELLGDLKEVLAVHRYKEPRLNNFSSQLYNALIYVTEQRRKSKPESTKNILQRAIMKLPEEFLEDLKDQNLTSIRQFIPEAINYTNPHIKRRGGLEYVTVKYGVTKLEAVSKDPINFFTPGFYNEDLPKLGLLGRFTLGFLLTENRLPNKKLIEILINDDTSESRSYNIKGNKISSESILDIVKLVYSAINDPEKISCLTDITEQVLEGYALSALKSLISIKSGSISEIIKRLEKDKDHKPN